MVLHEPIAGFYGEMTAERSSVLGRASDAVDGARDAAAKLLCAEEDAVSAWGRAIPVARIGGGAAIGVNAGIVNAFVGGMGTVLHGRAPRNANSRQGRKRSM